jgi:hypothetical protein
LFLSIKFSLFHSVFHESSFIDSLPQKQPNKNQPDYIGVHVAERNRWLFQFIVSAGFWQGLRRLARPLHQRQHVVVLEEENGVGELVQVRETEQVVVVLERQLAGGEGRHRLAHDVLLGAELVAERLEEAGGGAGAGAAGEAVHQVEVEQEVAALGLTPFGFVGREREEWFILC